MFDTPYRHFQLIKNADYYELHMRDLLCDFEVPLKWFDLIIENNSKSQPTKRKETDVYSYNRQRQYKQF